MSLEKIKIIMKQKGYTAETLAQKCGVPKSTIDKITCGVTPDPRYETVKAIANGLDLTIDELSEFLGVVAKEAQTPNSDTEKLLSLYNQLDAFDRGVIMGKIETLLESSKYKPRKVAVKKENGIAG